MKRYIAFISYRHREPDQQVSTALLRGLEGYHLPKDSGLPARRRVFRDSDELPTGTDLGANIEGALDKSEWLIALCSKEYLASQWCLLEIRHFIQKGRKDRILPVLLSDTPETAVPEEIRDVSIAADLRGEDHTYDRKKLSGMIPAILARMAEGTAAKGMSAEDFAASERSFRLKAGSGIAACVLAGILSFAAYALHTADMIAEGNGRIAEATEQTEKARQTAEEERREALIRNAQYVAERAMEEYSAGNDDEAIRLALSVLPEDPGNSGDPLSMEALSVLRMAMSRPRDVYRLARSAETDFEIAGYQDQQILQGSVMRIAPGPLLLLPEEYTGTETFFDCETGELTEEDSEKGKQALEEGYSLVYTGNNIPNPSSIFFLGAEKQMKNGLLFTLNGEPFYADRIVQEKEPLSGKHFAAWLEHPAGGQDPHMALFSEDQAEAVAEIPVAGAPRCAEFVRDSRYSELAVLDRDGRIFLYDTESGKLKKELPGRWRDINYPYEPYRICAASADGSGWSILDTADGRPIQTVETPSPVLKMSFSAGKSALLTLCGDGVRIYDLESGKLLASIFPEEMPRFAFWRSGSRSDGNTVILLFERRAEVWSLDSSAESAGPDAVRLYEEGVYNRCEFAFYSRDGKTLYLEMMDGTLSAWDAGSGNFLWADQGDWNTTGSHIPSVLSEDGSFIWRREARNGGMEKIDASTGEILYYLDTVGDGKTPVESPDRKIAVQPGIGWSGMKAFDLQTGEPLWRDESGLTGELLFSEDGSSLLHWGLEMSDDEYAEDLTFSRLDPLSGEVLEQRVVLHLKDIAPDRKWQLKILKDERLAVVFKSYALAVPGTDRTDNLVWLVDLDKWEDRTEVIPPVPEASVVFPADGGLAFAWKGEASVETAFVCRVGKDGTLGEALSAYSEEGRRILSAKAQLVSYDGEDAALDSPQVEPEDLYWNQTPHSLRRLSDNALFLDAGEHLIAAPARGESLCIYSEDTTPVLFLSSDPAELIRKARERMEEQS